MRRQEKEYFDQKFSITDRLFDIEDIVLLHESQNDNSHSAKLNYKWRESFKIEKTNHLKESYQLQKLNETSLIETYLANRLKPFYRLSEQYAEQLSDTVFEIAESENDDMEQEKDLLEQTSKKSNAKSKQNLESTITKTKPRQFLDMILI